MSFDYDLKSNLVAMISNHSQSQSKLQLDKETGLLTFLALLPCIQVGINRFHFFEKRLFRLKNDKEKIKNEMVVLKNGCF